MSDHQPTRRDFMGQSAAAAAAAATLGIASRSYAAGEQKLRVGLVGAGGRGTGAATNAMHADPQAQIVAIGDAFEDRARQCVSRLESNQEIADQIDIAPDMVFSGFDAYKNVIDNVDVVLLCEPPHFRPMHLEYAIEQGKHVFAEKPVAVDPVGVRRVLDACRKAEEKNLSVVSGLCYRYHHAKRATIERIHDGQVGEIRSLETYYLTGGLWYRQPQEHWSEMERQIRNWLYFSWLSGDFITEQHVHSLDKILWVMQDKPPVSAHATGGRAVRKDERYGDAYDQYYTIFDYGDGLTMHSACRQWANCQGRVTDHVIGTTGRADLMSHRITGENDWRWRNPDGLRVDMYQQEHDEFFAGIRDNELLNNGVYMSYATMMAVMARMSAYTGQRVTWEDAMASDLDLTPERYDWDYEPQYELAVPGVTEFG